MNPNLLPQTFVWYAPNWGWLFLGVLLGSLGATAFYCYPRSAWAGLGMLLGVALLFLLQHFGGWRW